LCAIILVAFLGLFFAWPIYRVWQPSQRQTAHDNTKRQPAGVGCLHCRVLPDLPMTHIDDWLDEPATNETEKLVKEWLEHYRRPAIEKDHKWLSAREDI